MTTKNKQKTYGLIENSLNRKIISNIVTNGDGVLKFPSVKTSGIALVEKDDKIFDKLEDFDWLIFTDVLSVEYFLAILMEKEYELFLLDDIRVCSLGEAVADRLRFDQLHSDVVPKSQNPQIVFDEIQQYVFKEKELSNLRFLIICGTEKESELVRIFREAGIDVCEIPVYKFELNQFPGINKLKTLLIGGAIDEFICSSPTDLIYLRFLLSKKELANVFSETIISATDKITLHNLSENGFHPKSYTDK